MSGLTAAEMRQLGALGRALLEAQRLLARSRAKSEEAQTHAGKALMAARRANELSDEASELIKPLLLKAIRKVVK